MLEIPYLHFIDNLISDKKFDRWMTRNMNTTKHQEEMQADHERGHLKKSCRR